MAYSYALFNGDGSTTVFGFSFGYLDKSHISASVNGTPVSFSWLNDSAVSISPAPANGTVVQIKRNTPKGQPLVDFSDGSVLKEKDLDLSNLFNLYCAQEAQDGVDSSVAENHSGVLDGKGRRTTNFADPTDPTGLVTRNFFETVYTPQLDAKVTEATTQASNAAASASAAQTAETNAETAEVAAEAALADFRNRYQGAQATPPTTRTDGSPLQEGDLYFRSVAPKGIYVFSGSSWIAAGSAVEGSVNIPPSTVIATAGQTSVPVPGGYDPGFILVWVDGVKLDPPDINVSSGTDIVFNQALTGGEEITWVAFGTFVLANSYTKAESDSRHAEVEARLSKRVSVTESRFAGGAKGDGTTDDTAAVQAAINYAVSVAPATVHFPRGTYRITSALTGLAKDGLKLTGDGLKETTLHFTHAGIAVNVDAFASGSASDPFISVSMLDFTVKGNATTTVLVRAQGVHRANWRVAAKEANTASGIAFDLYGCMSNVLELMCSNDTMPMTNKPYEGLRLSAGTRAGVSVGNSSDNLLINPQFDSMVIGGRFSGADQTTVMGGAFQSNSSYGLIINAGSRYNTLIGTGFENPAATADFADAGVQNTFITTYAAKAAILQGRDAEINGGHFERIEVQAGAANNRIKRVTINQWASGSGGFVDNGTNTVCPKYYDADLAAFVYPKKDRLGITVGASPFTWVNNTGGYAEVIIQTGTLTQVRQGSNGDTWLKSTVVPSAGLWLRPGDSLEVSYSVAPSMSYVPHPGLFE